VGTAPTSPGQPSVSTAIQPEIGLVVGEPAEQGTLTTGEDMSLPNREPEEPEGRRLFGSAVLFEVTLRRATRQPY
jgi:hypothetical protein